MSNETQKPKSHRFNLFFKGEMWLRLLAHVRAKEKRLEVETIKISDEVHRALDKYLPVEKK